MPNKTREVLEPEHLRHFGLKDDPFFDLGDHKKIWLDDRLSRIAHLCKLAARHQGMLVMTGDFGAGKSTILRYVLREMIGDRRYHVIMPDRLNRKALTGDMLTLGIIDAMCSPGTSVPNSTIRRDKLAKSLLTQAMARGEYPLLVLDEAHDLTVKLLIALKRLWDSGLIFRHIGIVLTGAGGIDPKGRPWGLRWEIEGNPDLKEFAERVRLVDLGRLADAMPQYLAWRFSAVGTPAEKVFEPKALKIIGERGQTPQLTGNLAIRAMQEAYCDGALKVSADHALNA
ncbi:MAG: AAA family ATPase [Burkholderiales bacterium]|nr:AAA family ATPase [Burkholderiales bacterium]